MVYGMIASVILNVILFFLFIESIRSGKEAIDILSKTNDEFISIIVNLQSGE